jgi:Protein of unknown function (DUF2997)
VPEIEFTLDPTTGKVELQVKGIAGRACEDVAKLTAELLGAPDRERNTAEYYIRPRVRPPVRRTGGQWPR